MFEEDDRETGYAVFLAVTLAIVVSLFVIAIGIGSVIGEAGRKPPSAASHTPSVVRVIARVHFEPGKADAPEDSPMLLRPAIRAAKAAPNSRLVVSSYHDASGDAAANTELARRRGPLPERLPWRTERVALYAASRDDRGRSTGRCEAAEDQPGGRPARRSLYMSRKVRPLGAGRSRVAVQPPASGS